MIPRLLALKSAVPPYTLDQTDVSVRAAELFQNQRDITRLLPVFENTGIERRYSCVPIEWYNAEHGWQDRTELYVSNAVDLLEKVVLRLLEDVKLTI
ncbi:MAG: hypothetical protein ACRD3W_03335, partial [Terriglobales bacterium]